MLISYTRGQASVVVRVKILDSSVTTGAGLTGLAFGTAGLIIGTIADNEATTTAYTQAGGLIETVAALGTYAAPTATKCRFREVDATNHPGVYEIHLANARYAVASAKSLLVSVLGAADCAETDAVIPLLDLDPYSAMKGTDDAALAATALSTAVWTNAKAAFVDASINAIPTVMVGTDNAALAVTALSTGVWTNAKAAFLDASIAAIPLTAMRGTDNAALAVTALLDTTWTDAKAAFLDASIAAIPTVMVGTDNAALAATALSTGVWTNAKAAFLDASVAAIPTVMVGTNNAALAATALSTVVWTDAKAAFIDASVAAIPLTAMRGTDNAALAATALTDAVWTNAKAAFIDMAISDVVAGGGATPAQVWAYATRTLSAFNFTPSLDAAYDDAKTAAQAATALSTAVWTNAKAAYIDAAISSISTEGGVVGAGSETCNIYTETEDFVPMDGVEVWITTDNVGADVTAGTLTSDAMGLTTFYLDVGDYFVWRQLSGHNFTNPQTLAVV